jgi:hypothetical protein
MGGINMAFYEDFGSCSSGSMPSQDRNKSIPHTFIIEFITKLLNLKNSEISFDRSTDIGNFKLKADIDILNIVVQKLQFILWENNYFETIVLCEKNKIVSKHIGDKTKAKSKIAYQKIKIKELREEKFSILSKIQSIMSEYDIVASELDVGLRKTVKSL